MPDGAVGIEGSSLYLKKGETIRVETLLYGMLLHSGNDAATALAIVCSGSVEKFVSEMNERAKELGLCATHFANPSGLDSEENYSTARDLATLGAAAMQNPIFSEAVSAKSAQMDGRSFVNHNRLLWQYPGALGIKTGYTKAAGRILVSCAEKNGRMLIAVTVRDANDWADHAALLDGGFSQYRKCTLVQKGDFVGSVAILGGQKSFAALNAERELCVWLLPHEQVRLRLDAPTVAYAPIEEGMAGTLEAQVGGRTIGSVRVDYAQSVPQNAAGDDCAERFFGG